LSAGGAGRLRELRAIAIELAAMSPPPVADDLEAVADALERVAVTVESVPDDDPQGIVVITDALDRELGAVAEEGDDAAAYIDRWCEPSAADAEAPTTSTPP
jgi:hypothetical protein